MLTIAVYEVRGIPSAYPEKIVARHHVGPFPGLTEAHTITLPDISVWGYTTIAELAQKALLTFSRCFHIPLDELEAHRPRLEEAITHLRRQEQPQP